MRKPQKILITGAAGFIGSALTSFLCDASGLYHVTAVDNVDMHDPSPVNQLAKLRAATYFPRNMPERFKYDTCDITIPEDVERVFSYENYDVVIHLAAKAGIRESLTNPYAYAQTNLVGFTNVIEAARKAKVRHFLYASSSSVYGMDSERPFSEDQAANSPMSFYAATKRANEMMAYSYSSAHGMRTIGMRFFTVYGPLCRLDMAPFKFTDAIINNRPIDVYNYGNNTRDFTHISEVVKFIERTFMELPEGDVPAHVYNAGGGHPCSVLEFIECLEKAAAKKAILTLMPPQIGDMEHTEASTAIMTAGQRRCFAPTNFKGMDFLERRQKQIQHMVNWVKLYQSYNRDAVPSIELMLKSGT